MRVIIYILVFFEHSCLKTLSNYRENFYNRYMERLIEMGVVIALLYAGYALGIKRWNYSSQADRERRRALLKEKGLCNTFYFIHAGLLFFLIVFSGGTFTFYWIYQQWKAICQGFKRTDGRKLSGGPLAQTLKSPFSFFTLGGIINRTCEYMHKSPAWPSGWWGSVWLCGFVTACIPWAWSARIIGAFLFCIVPPVYQRHLNTLPKKRVPVKPKPKELIAAALGLVVVIAVCLVLRLAVPVE